VLIAQYHQVGTFGTETDFLGSYALEARDFLAGKPYTYSYQPPGYALLLAGASFLVRDLFLAGKLISAVAAALFGWLTYLLLRDLFDRPTALAAIVMCFPVLLPHSFLAVTDVIAAAAIALTFWILLRRHAFTSTTCFATGLSAGAAYLLRTEGMFLVAGVALSLLFVSLNNEPFTSRLRHCGLFLGGVLLITLPWLIYNWARNGSPVASDTHLIIAAHFYNPAGDTWQEAQNQEGLRFRSVLQVLTYNPLLILKRYLKDVLYWNPLQLATEGLQFPAYLFAGAGFVWLIQDLSRRRLVYFGVCLLGYFSLGLAGFRFRYFLYFLPVLFLMVSYALFHKDLLIRRPDLPFLKIPAGWAIVAILALCLSAQAYKQVRQTLNTEPRYLLDAAKFLRERSSPNDIIIARKPHIAYLSNLRQEFYPLDTADQYLAKAREIGARYLVYSDFEASIWPGLKSFKDPEVLPPGFTLIYRHEPTHTLIYEIES
jgi:4-amino-4-deoxy-L-arabinose transferase-like glycosyltransferase